MVYAKVEGALAAIGDGVNDDDAVRAALLGQLGKHQAVAASTQDKDRGEREASCTIPLHRWHRDHRLAIVPVTRLDQPPVQVVQRYEHHHWRGIQRLTSLCSSAWQGQYIKNQRLRRRKQ